MAISFDGVPASLRTPFVAIEFDASASAGNRTAVQPYKALLIGQKLSSGSVPVNTPTRISSKEQAKTYFGAGSMLAAMAEAFFANNDFTEVWADAIADDASGVAAEGMISVSGPASAAGAIHLYIGGHKVKVAVADGHSASSIASAIAAAINAEPSMPVSASASNGDVTLTAKHKGEFANELDIRTNYFSGEETPEGVSLSISDMSGGVSNPEIAQVFADIGDQQFNVVAMPYTDSANLAALKDEMDERFGPMKQIEGIAFAAKNDSASALQTFGSGLNTQHISIMGAPKVPTACYEIAAAMAAIVSYHAPIDPARPFQTLPIKAVKAPKISDRLTQSERNNLLFDGISTFSVGSDGECKVERLITTYQTSPAGAETDAYLDVETLLTLSYIRYDLRNFILAKYPRHKLANDGTRVGAGQQVVTPRLVKAELLTRFRAWEEQGLVESFDQFKKDLIVERSPSDPNRLNVLLPPDLINALRITAIKVQFRI